MASNKIKKILAEFSRLITILILIIMPIMFFIGFHNLDLSHNAIVYEVRYNTTLLDRASNFKLYDTSTMYITGINYMIYSFIICYTFFLLFVIYQIENKKTKR